MKILLVNQTWFSPELREAGHEVLSVGEGEQFDVPLVTAFTCLTGVMQSLPGRFEPDIAILFDDSRPIIYSDFADLGVPTIYYSVDTHHHHALHRLIAPCFDHICVAQRDYLDDFATTGTPSSWLPLWASRYIEPRLEKEFGAVFIGTLNRKLNPRRVEFFAELQKRVPVECLTGDFAHYYPRAHIVLNQTVKGDLNFRVFEAMMSGSLLLTEDSGNGLTDLFTPGTHLGLYQRGDIEQLAGLIEHYLSNPVQAATIGMQGRDEILEHHTSEQRALQFLSIIESTQRQPRSTRWLAEMVNFTALGDNMLHMEPETAKASYAVALRALYQAISGGERITEELALCAASACLKFDRYASSNTGKTLLYELTESFPDIDTLLYLRTRILAQRGEIKKAMEHLSMRGITELAETLSKVDRLAETLMTVPIPGSQPGAIK